MTTATLTLSDFLLARIAEDEERARRAICQCGGPVCTPEQGWMHMGEAVARLDSRHVAEHVVEWSPARVLAECEAKRRIVELHGFRQFGHQCVAIDGPTQHHVGDPCATVQLLALPYADHPDYHAEWRP